MQRMKLRHEIYFSLTKRQQRKFNERNCVTLMEQIPMVSFKEITKNKKLWDKLILLKRSGLHLAA